ncbi:MAG: efflux RND transporter periplasmic adaptor subunit [Lysobacterales bacterium]
MMSRFNIWLVLAAAVGVSVIPVGPVLAQSDPENRVLITTVQVAMEPVSPLVPAAGTVFSRRSQQITAGLAARLAYVAQPGQRLEEGQPVARFDCQWLELQREEQDLAAQREHINLQALSVELDRLEQMPGLTSALRIDQVRANRDLAENARAAAKVRVRQTEQQISRCTTPAPFSGVVTTNGFQAGEDVPLGAMVAALTDINHLEVRASVPVRYLPRLEAGIEAQVRHNRELLMGQVRTIVPAADATSQTFEVRIDLPADGPQLLAAGQLVSVSLPLAPMPSMTLPRDAVVLRAGGAYVMRITADMRVEEVPVRLSDAGSLRVVVEGSLSPGDRVALRGAEALHDRQHVDVITDS